MASYKLNIAEAKTGKCYKTEVKDEKASPFMGLNIGEKIEGSKFGIDDYEFMLTGGTDYCGFPMRHGILGIRKKITIYPSTGFKGGFKGMKKRKTVRGHKVNESISAINLKATKEGPKKLSDIFGAAGKEGKEDAAEAKAEKPAEKKPEDKAKAPEQAKEKPKVEAKEEKPKTAEKEEKKEEKQ
jgi:small subunit ribosomal protein S6e